MKTKYRFVLSTFAMAIVCLDVSGQTTNRTPDAMVTIKVTDEGGAVLTGMPVHVWFDDAVVFDGTTDSNGTYIAHGRCSTIDPPIRIEKDGFYLSSTRCRFTNVLEQTERKWMPWNPVVTMIVRKVVNPIPMYAKMVETKLPTTDSPCGYDLVVGDWVAPNGRGFQSDFVFTMEGFDGGMKNYESHLTLNMKGSADGIQRLPPDQSESAFALCRSAPETAYDSTWTNAVGYLPGKGFFETQGGLFSKAGDKPWGYIFRIRSVTDEQGKITEALYGKVRGPIRFFNCTERVVQFTYYLNPTPNDRNLEFDPTRNLFKDLKPTEQVRDP